MTKQRNDTPRIYVASLSDYNAGRLHGCWIDCDQGYDGVMDEIKAMLAESKEYPAEEWAIHDYEYFGDVKLHEYADIQTVVDLAEFIEEHGELGAKLYTRCDKDLDQAKQMMEEGYIGEYNNIGDYAAQYTLDTNGKIPDFIDYYVDYDSMGEGMESDGEISTISLGDKVHVFIGNI